MIDPVKRFLSDRSGATAMEYCFIASLIAMAIVGGLTTTGTKIGRYFSVIAAVN